MRNLGTRTAIAAAFVAAAAPRARAQATDVRVEVVDVAGGRAYVTPGARAGLISGATIQLGGKRYVVIDATADHAAIDVGQDPVVLGATGSAHVEPAAQAAAIARLPAPHPLADFTGQWRAPVHPADTQEVKAVPLGSGTRHGRARVAVRASAFVFAPRTGDVDAGAALGARVSLEPWAERPFAIDADAAAQIYQATGGDSAARPIVVVREARLRWGSYADPQLAAGRLRWAATAVGLLDGARVAGAAGGVELAAFGGLVPDPISGKPSTDASRFGAELILDRPRAPWAPRLSLTASGSTWKGTLDERRLTAIADAAHGPWSLSGYAEAQAFAADNPWGERALDLTSAGAGAAWHDDGGRRFGLDLSFRRPERSLRLDAFLPPDWQCRRAPQPAGTATEPCAGNESRTQATASGSWDKSWGGLDGGVTAIHATGSAAALEGAGFLDARVALGRHAHAVLGASAGRAAFLDWVGGRAGVGVTGAQLDVTLYYRPSLLGYTAATATFLQHRVGVDLGYAVRANLTYGLLVEGQTGPDADAVTAIATMIWRPR